MFIIRKSMRIKALVAIAFLFAIQAAYCSSVSSPTSSDESLPQLSDVILFKIIASKLAQNIPDKVIKTVAPQSNPSEIRNALKQFIIAGADIFDLALQIKSGELTHEFREKLEIIRREFKQVNTKLVAESKKIQELKEMLKKASSEEKVRIIQDETATMLTMFENMAGPMHNVSVAFKDLNGMIVTQLLQVLELIPPIKPYLTINGENNKDKIMLSTFMGVKLQEMIKYTEALKKIGLNLKNTYKEMQEDILKCKIDLEKKYKAVSVQKNRTSKEAAITDTKQAEQSPE